MEERRFFEIHRSDAIKVLLSKEKTPSLHTNLRLAELLEERFPKKDRHYIVKEDDIELNDNALTSSTF
ncbi:MAG: hypothetical protein WC333_01485 [Dehalococcoidia bacterium]|jgi:hypothetical protein